MDENKLIIIGVIIVILAVIAGFMLTSSSDDSQGDTKLDILTQGAISENGTIDVKLTNIDGVAIRDKVVHVSVTDDKGNVVFSEDVTTYANGVANVKLNDVKAGTYNIEVTFDGDDKFTSSSVSEKLTINPGVSEEPEDNSTSEDTASVDSSSTQSTASTPSYSSSSSSYSSSSSSSSHSSSDGGGSSDVIDENGNAVETVIDENGNEVSE